jgi:DNA-directed RNA polymerase specialized sigma24 family protein
MAATDPVSEPDLDEAFEQGSEFGIRYLNSECKERILRYIKRCGRGFFNHHDLLDVYQETLIAMHGRASKVEFDPCRSLRMVMTIARNKSLDLLRKRGHRLNLNVDAILDAVAADTKGSDIHFQWKLHIHQIDQMELREVLLEFITTLPERQRIVAHCFINNYEDIRLRDTYRPLADAVGAITGNTESVAAVKSVWRLAREKIIAELQRRGYTYITVE